VIIKPDCLDQFLSAATYKLYVDRLLQRGGITRRRAEYFVRLWAYLLLKQLSEEQPQLPPQLKTLYPPKGFISCTHGEACQLFYHDQDKGSDRAAGLMIDKLTALGLLNKKFDGQTLCLQVRDQPELMTDTIERQSPAVFVDRFHPGNDAIPTAKLMTQSFYEMVRQEDMTIHKISKCLRHWGAIYPGCIRIFRRSDTQNPVGVLILYPTMEKCERLFFGPPSKGFYLTNDRDTDPFEMALPGDPTCTSIYVRAWIIDPPYMNAARMQQLIETCQITLREMRQDYPALRDMYSMIIHPSYEQLREIMGFEKIAQDTQRAYAWVYLAIDRYLALDPAKTVAALTAGIPMIPPKESEQG
jgi:hypothetical protein